MSPASGAPDRRKPYHHGSLRSALVEASIALAREGGPERVVLREAARVAGVSHGAAYRHFADREALLAEVSRYARSELATEMRRRVDRTEDPVQRLQAVGTAYVDFALAEPGLFRIAFSSRPARRDSDDPDRLPVADDGDDPHTVLSGVLDQVRDAGLLHPSVRQGAEIAAWSTVHGLAMLLLDGALPTTGEAVEFARNQALDLIGRGLLTGA